VAPTDGRQDGADYNRCSGKWKALFLLFFRRLVNISAVAGPTTHYDQFHRGIERESRAFFPPDENGWNWKLEFSSDGGESWLEVYRIKATRSE
jgi:hypothetical protein